MPRPLTYALLVLIVLAMIPPALIMRTRAVNRELPRIHLMQDMGIQHKFRGQDQNPLFADGRAMRPPMEGTVARGELRDDDHSYRGIDGEGWATRFPARTPVTMEMMERGRERYDIFCQVCHGISGHGDGLVHRRSEQLMAGGVFGTTWVPPTSLHDPTVREMPVGQLFHIITNGVRNMPPYGHQIPVEDRWAIVAYIRALQRSQTAEVGE